MCGDPIAPKPPRVRYLCDVERFGRYRVTGTLGKGAMGEVHLAVDEVLGRVVKGVPKAALVPALVFAWLMAIVVSHGSSAKFIYFDF